MGSKMEDELDDDRQKSKGASMRNKSSGIPTAEDLLKPSDSFVSTVEESSFNDLFWDQIIKYAATAMIALTLLDLLSSIREDTVQCMTPSNFTRDQGAYINSYCSQFTPPTVYFPFFLVGQATIIYGLHFLWFSWFSGKFHYFLSLATSLDRCRESKTGSYSLRNFVLCRALLGCFEGSKTITLFYILKLLLQLLLSGIFIYFSFEVEIFGNYSPPFVCPRSDSKIPETWPIGGYRVPCVLTSLNLLVAVRWLNVILLSGICFSALYGFVWCLWEHKSRLNWVLVADFSFLSGLPPYMYVPKRWKQFWKSWEQFCQYRIRGDFHFLLLKLYREDAGHAQVLREVLIDDFIRKREQRQFERLNLWKNLGKTSLGELKRIELSSQGEQAAEEADISSYNWDQGRGLGSTLQSVLYNSLNTRALGLAKIDVLDIAFGTSGYKLQMAAKSERARNTTMYNLKGTLTSTHFFDERVYKIIQLDTQVVAVDLNPHYLNEKEPVCKKMYTAGITHFKTLDNIFAKEKNIIDQFRDQLINEYCPLGTQPTERTARANTILVGPIPASSTHGETVPILNEHMANVLVGPIPASGSRQEAVSSLNKRSRVVSIHWLLKWMEEHDLLSTKSYLVTVTPQTVEGKSVHQHFVEFKPDPGLGWKSPITLYRKSKAENTYMVCRTLPVGGQSPVENRTEQSAVENSVEPSVVTVENNVEQSAITVENNMEHSAVTVENNVEQSTVTVENIVEQSTVTVENNVEHSTVTVENNVEQSAVTVENNVEQSVITPENNVEQSVEESTVEQSVNTVENNVEQSAVTVENNVEQSVITVENNMEQSAVESTVEQSVVTVENTVEQSTVVLSKPVEHNYTSDKVTVRCGQSTCEFLIKIYCIPKRN